MDPATIIIVTTLLVGVLTLLIERTFSHVKKSKCFGAELEMKSQASQPNLK